MPQKPESLNIRHSLWYIIKSSIIFLYPVCLYTRRLRYMLYKCDEILIRPVRLERVCWVSSIWVILILFKQSYEMTFALHVMRPQSWTFHKLRIAGLSPGRIAVIKFLIFRKIHKMHTVIYRQQILHRPLILLGGKCTCGIKQLSARFQHLARFI